MGIAHFIREIGRGKQGAKDLSRQQACELMTDILNDAVDPIALGAFCIAMRIKGETSEEMLGFLDALQEHLQKVTNLKQQPVVVLPSYNGSRRLPLLTPLLAKLLAQQGHAVLVHGCSSEDQRIHTEDVLSAMGIHALTSVAGIESGKVVFAHTQLLSPALWSLLQVRRQTGLRNSAHSLVKLMNPVQGPSVLVCSYTHPEYATAMQTTLQAVGGNALLLRGTEGEPVADPRKIPTMQCFLGGHPAQELGISSQTQHQTLDMPLGMNAVETADFIEKILAGQIPVPNPIQVQVELISRLAVACTGSRLKENTP